MAFLLPGMRGLKVIKAPPIANKYSCFFDGTDDYINPGVDFLTQFRSTFSVLCWLKYTDTSGTQMIFAADSEQGGDNNRINIYRAVGETRMSFKSEGVDSGICSWSHDPATGWNQYLFVFRQDGSDVDLEIYANGVQRATLTKASMNLANYGTSTNYDVPYIGARNQGDASNTPEFSFDGYIDEFAIFPSDQSTNANDLYGGAEAPSVIDLAPYSPYLWYRMGDNDGGAGTTVTDQGSGGNDGSLVSGAAFQLQVV